MLENCLNNMKNDFLDKKRFLEKKYYFNKKFKIKSNKKLINLKDYNNNFLNFKNNLKNFRSILNISNFYSYDLDNQFTLFEINNIYYLIAIDEDRISLKLFELNIFTHIKTYKNMHLNNILCIRYYKKENKNIFITSSCDDSVKVFLIKNNLKMNIIIHIKNIYGFNNSYFNTYLICSVIMLTHKNKDYIIISNRYASYLKVYNLKGNICKDKFCEHNLNGDTYYIQHYYEKNKNYIIKCNNNLDSITSFDFETGKMYKYYINKFARNCVIKNINNKTLLFFAEYWESFIYIIDFHKGNLINLITLKDNPMLNLVLLWNNDYLLATADDNQIHVIDINKKIEVIKLKNSKKIFNLDKIKINNIEYLFTEDLIGNIIIWK